MKKKGLIITLDGPAGVGKSTVSKILGQKLEYVNINTGAMYRAVAWQAKELKIKLNDELKIIELANKIVIQFKMEGKTQNIYINGINLTPFIYNEEISSNASTISKIKGVRDCLLPIQRKMGEDRNVVMEGRDIGTVVFPDADIKFFITASSEERANRRYKEMKEKGIKVDYDIIFKKIKQRDIDDSTRLFAPLKKAENAIEIDTTKLSVDEVVCFMLEKIEKLNL